MSAERADSALRVAISAVTRLSRRSSFFQVTRLLYRIQARPGRPSEHVPELGELARFTSQVSMAFPTGDISGFKWEAPSLGRSRRDPALLPEMEVSVMGLAGHLGPLPDAYTALITRHPKRGASPLGAFLDIFNHRLLCLFYSAWELGSPWLAAERGVEDGITRAAAALSGLGAPSARAGLPVQGALLIPHAASLLRRPLSARTLHAILASHLGETPFEIRELVGAWLTVDGDSLSRLGGAMPTCLGAGAVLGRRFWDVQGRATVRLGPLSYTEHLRHLPGSDRANDVALLVKILVGSHLTVSTEVVLERQEIPGLRMRRSPDGDGRLGRSAWLGRPPGRGPVVVRLGPGSGARVRDEVLLSSNPP